MHPPPYTSPPATTQPPPPARQPSCLQGARARAPPAKHPRGARAPPLKPRRPTHARRARSTQLARRGGSSPSHTQTLPMPRALLPCCSQVVSAHPQVCPLGRARAAPARAATFGPHRRRRPLAPPPPLLSLSHCCARFTPENRKPRRRWALVARRRLNPRPDLRVACSRKQHGWLAWLTGRRGRGGRVRRRAGKKKKRGQRKGTLIGAAAQAGAGTLWRDACLGHKARGRAC